MDEDPAFYKRFSQMIQQCIYDFLNERISEIEYLKRIKEYRDQVLSKTDSSIPERIRDNPSVSAYYGSLFSFYKDKEENAVAGKDDLLAEAALHIGRLIDDTKELSSKSNTDSV